MTPSRAACAALFALAPAIALAASPFDGFWMIRKPDKSLDPGSQVEFRIEREHVAMDTPMGASYRAKLDGSDAPMAGDANTTSVSVRMPNKHTLVETDKNAGKPWRVTTIEIDADGRTAKVSWKNLKNSESGGYTLSKQ
jgi:hypothetical protein